MGSVRKLTSGRWQAMYRDAGGRQRSFTRDTKREAEAELARVTTQLHDGTWVDPTFGRVPFEQWAVAWQDARVVERTTYDRDDSLLRTHVLPKWTGWPLNGITTMAVRSWVATLSRSGLSPATVHKCYYLLSSIMDAAANEHPPLIRSSPCRNVELPEARDVEQVFLTPDEFWGRLLPEIPALYQGLVIVMYTTGLRPGEAYGLKVHRVNFLRRVIQVREALKETRGQLYFGPPKTKKSRRDVTAAPVTIDAIAKHLKEYPQPDPEGLVFRGLKGAPISRTRFNARIWTPATERAGFYPRPRPHDLRHSHAADLIDAGNTPLQIQERLGHDDIRTTMKDYGHLFPAADERLLAALEARHGDRARGARLF